jgi:hypothetical protein
MNSATAETETVISRDVRIAYHESAHLTVGRALGAAFGGATIVENTDLGYGGLCWGTDHKAAFSSEGSSTVIEQISSLMPGDGDTRDDDTTLIYAHVHNRVVELCAGSEAERMQFGDAWAATDDRKQEKALVALIYSSPEAQRLFIEACAAEARAILGRHADVVDALAAALVEHRTLDGEQIDETISRAVAARQLQQEYERRRQWREMQARAERFEQQCRV